MLVKDFRKPEEYFGNIEPGTVFALEDNFYMAIKPIEETELGNTRNAVNLETGQLRKFNKDDRVTAVSVECNIIND